MRIIILKSNATGLLGWGIYRKLKNCWIKMKVMEKIEKKKKLLSKLDKNIQNYNYYYCCHIMNSYKQKEENGRKFKMSYQLN